MWMSSACLASRSTSITVADDSTETITLWPLKTATSTCAVVKNGVQMGTARVPIRSLYE